MLYNKHSDQAADLLLQNPETLALFSFSGQCGLTINGEIQTGLRSLDDRPFNEVWYIPGENINSGNSDGIHWRKSKDFLAVSGFIPADEWTQNIEAATRDCYGKLLGLIHREGYSNCVRFWNFLPCINVGSGDDEAYKRFCTGRLQAFTDYDMDNNDFPAASAVGHHSQGASITVIASKTPGKHHQNRLQVNAFQYPRKYGLTSPSFARATTVNLEKQSAFFVSGTASIFGHQTIADGSLSEQIENTCKNIRHLLTTFQPQNTEIQTFKVFLRHPKDLAEAKALLEAQFPGLPMVWTESDICRSDLLIEVECFCGPARDAAA